MALALYTSREQVAAQWKRMIKNGEEGLTKEFNGGLPRDFNVVYMPGNNWRYVISLAKAPDAAQLSALSDEFVSHHIGLFPHEYQAVDYKVWSRYLGFPTAATKGMHLAVQNVSRNQAARLSVHTFRNGGCVLKCEAEALSDTEAASPDHHADHCCNSKGIVGYVHFTFEEGGSEDGMRHSKRLKRKRGEGTGEYVKVGHLVVTQHHSGSGIGPMLMTAMMQCVRLVEPSFTKEVFLTAMEKNGRAIRLYQQLGLQIIGQNTTHLGMEDRRDFSRPVVWYQLGLSREELAEDSSPEPRRISQQGPSLRARTQMHSNGRPSARALRTR